MAVTIEEQTETAPGRLELVREFVNTLHIDLHLEDPDDRLRSPRDLTRWLREHELLPAGVVAGEADLTHALEVRESVRSLLAANHGEPVDDRAIESLRRASERAGLGLAFHEDGTSALEPASDGVDAALGRLLAEVNVAMVDGTWGRLKICPADDCRWAFYDHSRNHSRRWCSMSACGNRAKVRSYRQRNP
jgi:predicted RNA-binding Zn ribbon-like protein